MKDFKSYQDVPPPGEKTLEMALLKQTRAILDAFPERSLEVMFFSWAINRCSEFDGFDIEDLPLITGEELIMNLEEYEKEEV